MANQQPYSEQQPVTPRDKKPWYKRTWFIILAIIVLILILAAACGGGDNDQNNNATSSQDNSSQSAGEQNGNGEKADDQAGSNEQSDEDKKKSGNDSDAPKNIGETVSLKKADVTLSNIGQEASPLGDQLVCGDVQFQNTSDKDQLKLNGLTDWKATDPNGVTRDLSMYSDYDSVEVGPGGSKSGRVCFETDGASGEYTFQFEEGLSFTSDTATWKAEL